MAISTDIVSTLGAGSGVDVKTLAQNLADAEIQPRKDLINTKITQTEAKISAYGYIRTALLDLQNAFKKLDDASDFASLNTTISQPTAVGVTTTASAQAASYSLNVTSIASAQSIASSAFAAKDTAINGGTAFTLNLSVGGAANQAISVTTATPAGVVSAINSANAGIKAQLINTGDASTPYKIVVTGATGASNNFTITAVDGAGAEILDGAGAKIFDTSNPANTARFLQTAGNAQLSINGLNVTRASNQFSDLVEGVTFNLNSTTSGAARIDLSRQTQSITDNLKYLVAVYNDLELTLSELGNKDSDVEVVGGALVNNSILQTVRSTVRGYITNNSSTPSGSVNAARDVGLSFDRQGQLKLDESKLNTAIQNNFDEVVTMFTAGTNGKSVYSTAPAGVAGDAVAKLDQLLRNTGLISTQSDNASKKVENYKAELTKLDDRLSQILARYIEQFSVMESLVGSTKALQTSLKSSFEGMMATYTKG